MNIKKIKEVVNLDISDEQKEIYILSIIADDKKAIPTILNILNSEREKREELILDANAELSRALIVLKDDNLKYNKKIIADPKWVSGEIIKHIKSQEWDKGWRWGLLAATIVWIVASITVRLSFL